MRPPGDRRRLRADSRRICPASTIPPGPSSPAGSRHGIAPVYAGWRTMVFIVEAIGSGLAVIGCTRNVDRRLKNLSAVCPFGVRVVRVFDGDGPEALELRLRFRAYRHHGEWYVLGPIASALATLETIELVEVANRCPRCGQPRSVEHWRSDHRGKYCLPCSQKHRWATASAEERAHWLGGIVDPSARKKGRAVRTERIAQLRASKAVCIDCGVRLPIQPSSKVRADADRRCRSCGMRAAWLRPEYQRARAAGRAAMLARKATA